MISVKKPKPLGFYDIYSIASGAMISSGIFILPAFAFARAGSSVIISYLIAGLAAFLGILNVIELVTAMPKSGGDYYYITRTLGPLIGTVSGTLSWTALSLKSAFAIYGISQAFYLLWGIPPLWISIGITVLFTVINITGVELAARVEGFLVGALLLLLTAFIITGIPSINPSRVFPLLPEKPLITLSTAGFVFVSFGGIINVVTVSEEVRKPKRNIPLGMIASILSIVILYILIMAVLVGNMEPAALRESSAPVADTAALTIGPIGFIAITVAAFLAFLTTANAGILSASRYPMAMARDRLIPKFIGKVGKKFNTPHYAVLMTAAVIGASLLLPLAQLVKVASTVVLTANILAALGVLIIRASKLPSYRPSFKVPFFPVSQALTILVFGFLLVDIGLEAVEISLGLIVFGVLVYFIFGRKNWKQDYALLHLVKRATNRKIISEQLESELISILHTREETEPDPVDKVLEQAIYYDVEERMSVGELFREIAELLKDQYPDSDLRALFREREDEGSTALSPFFAIPHIVIDREAPFQIVAVRCREGIIFSDDREAVKAVFFLIGTKDQRTLHLKVLASLAQMVQTPNFQNLWLEARSTKYLKSLLLSTSRGRFN